MKDRIDTGMKDRIDTNDFPHPHLIKDEAIWFVRLEDNQLLSAPVLRGGTCFNRSELTEVNPSDDLPVHHIDAMVAVLLPTGAENWYLLPSSGAGENGTRLVATRLPHGPKGWNMMPMVCANEGGDRLRTYVPVYVENGRVFDVRTCLPIYEVGNDIISGLGTLNGPGVVVRCDRWTGVVPRSRWEAIIAGRVTFYPAVPGW